jgi:hypothetical protein
MRIFSARTAAKTFGAVLDAADAGPVSIHRHGRKRAVVIGWRLFEEYRKAYDDAVEDRYFDILERGLDQLAKGSLGNGRRAAGLAARIVTGKARLCDADAYTEEAAKPRK